MKNIFLTLILFVAIPVFGQRSIPHITIKAIEARMTDLKSSLFLIDSLYEDYLNVGSFTVQDGTGSDMYEGGSSWIHNRYMELYDKYPRQCPECKIKADEVTRLIAKELRSEEEVAYRKVIQKADDYFRQQNFLKAKEYYQRAVVFKPSDPYPKQKLEEVDAILAEQEKKTKE